MEIEDRINYHFKDKELLNEALSHSSYGNEFSQRDNERLEFLGDSIISFLVTKHLFSIFPEYNEGKLSKIKNQIVSTKSFYKIVKNNKLEKYLLLGKGETKVSQLLLTNDIFNDRKRFLNTRAMILELLKMGS